MKILLISGHGAGDSGAVGNGYKEADLTREVVNILKNKLSNYAQVEVYNQSRNAFKDVGNGTLQVNWKNYNYVFEVHFNAGGGKGTEIFTTRIEKAKTVEQKIMDKLGKYFAVRGVKEKNFNVIYSAKKSGVSSALLETCFIDNANDMSIYQSNKDGICQAIAEGIAQGFGLKAGEASQPIEKPSNNGGKDINTIADEVIAGKWGNGNDRKVNLENAGYNYNEVQALVNQKLTGKPSTPSKKSIDTVAQEVINGMWGVGQDRKNRLQNAGYDYNAVQNKVNQILGVSTSNRKSNETIANEVIQGLWGNGNDRKNRLESAGYNYNTIQSLVNKML